MANIVQLVENDTQPALQVTYTGVDVSAYLALRCHVGYQPNVLSVDGVVTDGPSGEFEFRWTGRVETSLSANASAGASQIAIQTSDYASLPTAGELEIDGTRYLYTSKTAPNLLNLSAPLSAALNSGIEVEKLPDLRAGRWPAEIEVTDAGGGVLTFAKLLFNVSEEIA